MCVKDVVAMVVADTPSAMHRSAIFRIPGGGLRPAVPPAEFPCKPCWRGPGAACAPVPKGFWSPCTAGAHLGPAKALERHLEGRSGVSANRLHSRPSPAHMLKTSQPASEHSLLPCARKPTLLAGLVCPRLPLQTTSQFPGSSSVLVNTEWAFYPPGLGLARSGPAGGSPDTCYPSIPLQLPGTSASSPSCITKSDDDPVSFPLVRNEADCIRYIWNMFRIRVITGHKVKGVTVPRTLARDKEGTHVRKSRHRSGAAW
jgi:hypothetical protein